MITRPLTVNHGGAITRYTYAADGARLLREDHQGRITATFGPVEIRNFGRPDEEVLTYPNPNIRLLGRHGSALPAPRSPGLDPLDHRCHWRTR